jgi:hypothetical protein
MNGARLLLLLLSIASLAVVRPDRSHPWGRLPPGPTAEGAASVIPMDRFFICGWLSPPAESTTAGRMDELAGAGMNLVLPALEDSGRVEDNLRRLDLAAARGQRCIIWDRRFERVVLDRPETFTIIDSIVADYRDHPAMLAYYLGDEPPVPAITAADSFFAALRSKDPAHPPWNNLAGRAGFLTHDDWIAHHRLYLSLLHPAVLCNDQYDFLRTGDRREFVENAAGLGALAREAGIPFWSFILLIEHDPYRRVTPGELRWQVSMLLAYGARGIGYFTYWTPHANPANNWKPAIIDTAGRRTEWYPFVAQWNRFVGAAGSTLARCTWLATAHAGSVPVGGAAFAPNDWVSAVEGRAALGYFADSTGARMLLVANSDSLDARAVTLTLPGTDRACVLDPTHDTWESADCSALPEDSRLTLDLDAGSLALLRLEGPGGGAIAAGTAPGLAVRPNPASAVVRLGLARVGRHARVEIIDAGGRRAWSHPVGSGASTVTWRGERDSGGIARPGVYFARLEDERGVTIARIVWLGANGGGR